MKVSIVICTRNRADSLRETLAALSRLEVSSHFSVELLVVDNGSTDHTQQVVAQTRPPQLPTRCLIEPAPGQVNARNRALAESESQVLLFTDDDVRVPSDWVDLMCLPIATGNADAVAGGVRFPQDRELEMKRLGLWDYRSWWASTDVLSPTAPTSMVGANMAFRRNLARQVGGFDPALGPGALGFYDETLFSYQLVRSGARLIGRLDVMVEHHFSLERLNRPAAVAAARAMGRSYAYVYHHWKMARSRLARWHLLKARLRRRRLERTHLDCLPETSLHQLLEATKTEAFCAEYLKQSRLPRRYREWAPATARA
jgi:glycosyltransferase involved in cell wall biosynthesis